MQICLASFADRVFDKELLLFDRILFFLSSAHKWRLTVLIFVSLT
jgi:hypothetical protein